MTKAIIKVEGTDTPRTVHADIEDYASKNQITRAVKEAVGWKGKPCKTHDYGDTMKIVLENTGGKVFLDVRFHNGD